MTELLGFEAIASLLTLTVLEIVLGIDNIIFISILCNRLPKHQQSKARRLGLAMALGGRIIFLSSITWIMRLQEPVMTLGSLDISWRDIILFSGGLFLIYKATVEIRSTVRGLEGEEHEASGKPLTYTNAITQIAILDVVFALDSMITAVGMADMLSIMIIANIIAMLVMLFAVDPVGNFIQEHPSLKMLALSFLLLVGVALVADGTHFHIPRNYIYFALAFSASTEFLNILAQKKQKKRRKKK